MLSYLRNLLFLEEPVTLPIYSKTNTLILNEKEVSKVKFQQIIECRPRHNSVWINHHRHQTLSNSPMTSMSLFRIPTPVAKILETAEILFGRKRKEESTYYIHKIYMYVCIYISPYGKKEKKKVEKRRRKTWCVGGVGGCVFVNHLSENRMWCWQGLSIMPILQRAHWADQSSLCSLCLHWIICHHFLQVFHMVFVFIIPPQDM